MLDKIVRERLGKVLKNALDFIVTAPSDRLLQLTESADEAIHNSLKTNPFSWSRGPKED